MIDQDQGQGACHGDSGGTAFVKVGAQLQLFGVTSRGYRDPASDCRKQSVYTNILEQSGFLQAAMRELGK